MSAVVVETNTPNIKGKPITIFVATDTDDPDTISLPADAPKFDLTIENPVLSLIFFNLTASANSETYELDTQTKRGSTPDTAKEWAIFTFDSIKIKKTAANAGFIGISYIPAGAQQT